MNMNEELLLSNQDRVEARIHGQLTEQLNLRNFLLVCYYFK